MVVVKMKLTPEMANIVLADLSTVAPVNHLQAERPSFRTLAKHPSFLHLNFPMQVQAPAT